MMAAITIAHDLPFVEVVLRANGQILTLPHVLLDTGSAATIFKTDDIAGLGITLQPGDTIRYMTGVGGSEAIVEKQIAEIEVGQLIVGPFTIQIGVLDYGIPLDGILGVVFLLQVEAQIDFRTLEIRETDKGGAVGVVGRATVDQQFVCAGARSDAEYWRRDLGGGGGWRGA